MTNKLSQWLIDYMKSKNVRPLIKAGLIYPTTNRKITGQAMNPFKYSIRLGSHVVQFINEKNNKQKGDK